MKEPTATMIYLAGPMDDVSEEEAAGWRDQLAADFPHVLFFMPNKAYRNAAKSNAGFVLHMNTHAIRCGHGLLANLTGPGRGYGTIREIAIARAHGLRVTVAADPADIGEHTLMAYDVDLFPTVDEAMTHLLANLADARAEAPMHPMQGLVQLFQPPTEDDDPDAA